MRCVCNCQVFHRYNYHSRRMNSIRQIEKLNQQELESNTPLTSSWHQDFKDTSYVYIGNLSNELNELDILVIFSQFGVPLDVKIMRDRQTGESRGFAFLKYEDWKSTVLAVDNLNGVTILDRIIRVDHCVYKPPKNELKPGEVDESAKYDEAVREEMSHDFVEEEEEEAEEQDPGLIEDEEDEEFQDPMAQFLKAKGSNDKKRRTEDNDRDNDKRHHRHSSHRHGSHRSSGDKASDEKSRRRHHHHHHHHSHSHRSSKDAHSSNESDTKAV